MRAQHPRSLKQVLHWLACLLGSYFEPVLEVPYVSALHLLCSALLKIPSTGSVLLILLMMLSCSPLLTFAFSVAAQLRSLVFEAQAGEIYATVQVCWYAFAI